MTRFVLVGAFGNLALTRILPALYELAKHSGSADEVYLVDEPVDRIRLRNETLAIGDACHAKYFDADELTPLGRWVLDNARTIERSWSMVAARAAAGPGRWAIYASIPPNRYSSLLERIGAIFGGEDNKARVILEKPLATSPEKLAQLLGSQKSLPHAVTVSGVDHYGAKGSVRSLADSLADSGSPHRKTLLSFKTICIDLCERQEIQDSRTAFMVSTGFVADMLVHALFLLKSVLHRDSDRFEIKRWDVLKLGQYDGYEAQIKKNATAIGLLEPDPTKWNRETYWSVRLELEIEHEGTRHEVTAFVRSAKKWSRDTKQVYGSPARPDSQRPTAPWTDIMDTNADTLGPDFSSRTPRHSVGYERIVGDALALAKTDRGSAGQYLAFIDVAEAATLSRLVFDIQRKARDMFRQGEFEMYSPSTRQSVLDPASEPFR